MAITKNCVFKVAWSVTKTATQTNNQQQVIFERVDVNLGGAWLVAQQLVDVGVAGIYYIYVDAASCASGALHVDIQVNGNAVFSVNYAVSDGPKGMSRGLGAVVRLEVGDEVSVVAAPSTCVYGGPEGLTTFSGFLVLPSPSDYGLSFNGYIINNNIVAGSGGGSTGGGSTGGSGGSTGGSGGSTGGSGGSTGGSGGSTGGSSTGGSGGSTGGSSTGGSGGSTGGSGGSTGGSGGSTGGSSTGGSGGTTGCTNNNNNNNNNGSGANNNINNNNNNNNNCNNNNNNNNG
jgi:hypothetical protein